jgi:hypothetical protein
MERASKNPSALIDVSPSFNERKRGTVILLSYRKAERCALVFVKHIGVNFVHE